jgi:hypothetical protein
MTIIELFDAMEDLIPRIRDGDTTKRITLLKNQAQVLDQEHSTLQSLYVSLQQETMKINKKFKENQTTDPHVV